MTLWEMFTAAVLGIVEGLTEYAPVSSTGHMIIADDIWLKSGSLMNPEAANSFKVVIQLGSILAVAIVFKDRILHLLGLQKKRHPRSAEGIQADHRANRRRSCSSGGARLFI